MPNTIETNADIAGSKLQSPPAGNHSGGAARFLVPDISDLLFVLLLAALTWGPLAKSLLADAGTGWHIRTGQLILSQHSVPRADPFSSTMHGNPWFAWEWLYDAGMAAMHHWAGLNGVAFLNALIIALTFTVLFGMMLARGANLLLAIVLLLPALAASTIHFFARPHMASWLLTLFWFGILDAFEKDGRAKRLIWLPPVMLLWVNVHGGFVLGFVLLAIFMLAALAECMQKNDAEQRRAWWLRLKMLTVAGAVSFLLTFVNPYGYKLHIHIYRYLTDRFLMDHIDEFLSPNFHGLPQRFFAGLVLLAVIGAGVGWKKLRVSEILLLLFAIYSGLYAARNIPISSMLLALIVAPMISSWFEERAGEGKENRFSVAIKTFGSRMQAIDARLRGHVWPALAVLLGLWACGHGGLIGGARLLDAKFDTTRFPVAAVDFLSRAEDAGAVFCPDRWGGYLIYRLYPHRLVAVDDRHDFYGTEFLKRYLKVIHGEPGWDEALQALKPEWVLVPSDSPLASLLSMSASWRTEYHDKSAVLFRTAASL